MKILRNIKIAKKLSLMIIVFLSAFIAFFIIAQVTIDNVKINGDIYNRIISGKDIIADILPPPEYIIEPYLVAQEMYQTDSSAEIYDKISDLKKLENDYTQRHDYWNGVITDSEMRDLLLGQSYAPAVKFFDLLDNQYIPAIQSGDKKKALEILNGGLKTNYEENRAGIDKVVVLANGQNDKYAAKAQSIISSMQITEYAVAGVLLALIIVFGVVISRVISKPIKETAKCARALADGKLEEPLEIYSKDETGMLAQVINKEVRTAFKNIEKASEISKKQAEYQTAEVNKLLINLGRLSEGELFCDIKVGEADEDTEELHNLFSKVSENLYSAVDSIKAYINEISSVLSDISDGELRNEIETEYKGDFAELKDSINRILNSLSSTMRDINTAAEQVTSGAHQVSNGAQETSQGATEQALSIEQLTASIAKVAQQTKQNAISANKANELTVEAVNDAGRGNKQMKVMQKAMNDINESSMNISKIIKVIDDIAFQTNILALNAAVEAARAGVHGKGFAVVAEEVRNLAARSASAAKETTALIEGSISKTEIGTKLADHTAAELSSIVEGVEKAAELISEIAHASNQQAEAIAEVNSGIEQMREVVQTNSATAEEGAAASQELTSQAEMLKTMVGRFRLKEAGEGRLN